MRRYKQVATRRRLELLTSAVTGRRSNQLNYRAMYASRIRDENMVGDNRIELLTSCL